LNSPIRVAVIGLGKIAHDQHLPAIAASPALELVATASPNGSDLMVPHFASSEALLLSGIAIDAVILCQPPQLRFRDAAAALRTGKHVLLEKPPGATTLEVEQLLCLAKESGTTLFAAWHSRFARAVRPACQWLAGRRIRSMRIDWREDVRHWHPGLSWIWEPGGLGVFDPGINALSVATRLLVEPLRLEAGTLEIPANRSMPIAAQLHLRSLSDVTIHAVFDWRETARQVWSLHLQTDGEDLVLSKGGAELHIDGRLVVAGEVGLAPEYAGLYEHFVTLVNQSASDVDVTPLRLVGDAFLLCRSHTVDAFD
jgi:predicted dehydrogenase